MRVRSDHNRCTISLQNAGDKASSAFQKNRIIRIELGLVPALSLRAVKLQITAHELPAGKNRFDTGYQIGLGP